MNQPNEYGIPLHACNGYRHDEHWWAWLRHCVNTSGHPVCAWLRSLRPEGQAHNSGFAS